MKSDRRLLLGHFSDVSDQADDVRSLNQTSRLRPAEIRQPKGGIRSGHFSKSRREVPLADEIRTLSAASHSRILKPNRNRPHRAATHNWRLTFPNSVQHNEFSGPAMIAEAQVGD
jgi:hypothetical protein